MSNKITDLEAKLSALEQQPDPDSCRARIDVLNELAWELKDEQLSRSCDLSHLAYSLATEQLLAEQPYQKGMADSLYNLCLFSIQLADYSVALAHGLRALVIYESLNSLKPQADMARKIGVAYASLGNYPEALTYYLKAVTICEQIDDQQGKAHSLSNMGNIYSQLNNYQQELEVYQQAMEIYQAINDQSSQAAALNNMAMAYYAREELPQALNCAEQSLHLARQTGLKMLEVNVLCTIGDIYLKMGDDQALHYLEQSMELAHQNDFKHIEAYALLSMGRVYSQLRTQTEPALTHLQQALTIATQIEAKSEMFACHKALSEVHQQRGNFEAALEHYKQFHTIREEVFNEEADKKLKNLQVGYETEKAKKEAEIYYLRNVELAKLNADKDKFFSIVAHDLRGPFGPVLGFAKMLADSIESFSPADLAEMSGGIYTSAQNVYNLLENLLDWSRLQLGRMEYQPHHIGLGYLANQSTALLREVAENKQINLENQIADDLFAYADENMIQTVIRNLISNALKFTPLGGSVTVSARLNGDKVEVAVTDTGVGMSPQVMAKLFKLGEHHTTTGTAHEKGTGLGLLICQEMVQKNGGQIWVESEVGVGTAFKFTLPTS